MHGMKGYDRCDELEHIFMLFTPGVRDCIPDESYPILRVVLLTANLMNILY